MIFCHEEKCLAFDNQLLLFRLLSRFYFLLFDYADGESGTQGILLAHFFLFVFNQIFGTFFVLW